MEGKVCRAIPVWLLVCCAMVVATLVVGGATRLTHSGLSIVEWQPIVGTLPPLSDAAWQTTFAKYQQTPEFQKINQHMTLAEFKPIFWWEFVHRFLGRGIGLVFLLPFLYFLLRRCIDAKLALRLSGIFLLGAVQGGMGWYMVQSGLVDDPRVSPYRLTAHLGLAFIIFAALFWVALDLLTPRHADSGGDPGLSFLRSCSAWLVWLIFAMALSGGLVAGQHAGLGYNSFPLMHGDFLPPDMLRLEPWFVNFFSNPSTVQFDHRLIAWLLILLLPLFWLKARTFELPPRARLAVHVLLLVFAAQISLGIATLLLVVPMPLALAHQCGAMLLFAACLWVSHELRCMA